MPLLRSHARRTAVAAALLVLVGCVNGESAASAEAGRALVRAATPERFAGLLRARYAARRACLFNRHFPTTVSLTPGDTSARARADEERYTRPYELLRAAGLVTREDVRPGDRDWWPPRNAHVDSGGTRRIVRYVLSERGRRDAEPDTTGSGPGERLCYARRRLVVIDTVVTRGPLPGWSVEKGVNFSGARAWVLHTVAFDSVAEWAPEVARRDTLQEVGPRPDQLEGPERHWASFGVVDGAWVLGDDQTLGPEGADRIEVRLARRSGADAAPDSARHAQAPARVDSSAHAPAYSALDTAVDPAASAAAADSLAAVAARYPRAFATNGKPLWRAGGVVSTAREAHQLRTVMGALPLLLALWWTALSLRALAVDVRRRAPVIVLAGVLGALGWAVLGPLMVSGFTAHLDDRYGVGPALLVTLTVTCLLAMAMSWGVADPRLKRSGIFSRSRPAPVMVGTEEPTIPTIPDHLRPGLLLLCRWTLTGVALGLLVVGVSYGYFFDGVRPGLPERLALGVAAIGVAVGARGLVRWRV